MVPVDAATQQQIVKQVAECGVAASQLDMGIDEAGGDIYVTVKARNLGDPQISCLMAAERREPYPILIFKDRQMSDRYLALDEAEGRREARTWLSQRGLLAQLPLFNPQLENVSSYARKLEAFCGLEPGTMLTVYSPTLLTVRPTWAESQLRKPASPRDEDRFTCLMNAITASNLKDRGIAFGFIGNEYVNEPKQR